MVNDKIIKENDKKLASFFYDIKNIDEYKFNSPKLEEYYNECMEILINKKFSNVNYADEKGNTYLHYVAKENKLNLLITLLELGADPTIKNNEGKNIFMMNSISNGGSNSLWKAIEKQGFRNFYIWENISKGYSYNAKQAFFDYYAKDNYINFEGEGEVNFFLKRNNIKTDKNLIKLVANLRQSLNLNPYFWYKKSYSIDDVENNNNFFISFLEQKIYWSKRANQIIDFLSERKINQTEEINKKILEIFIEIRINSVDLKMKNSKNIENLAEKIIYFIVENNFDLNQEFEFSNTKRTLQKELESNPFTFKIFLEASLNKNSKLSKLKNIKI